MSEFPFRKSTCILGFLDGVNRYRVGDSFDEPGRAACDENSKAIEQVVSFVRVLINV